VRGEHLVRERLGRADQQVAGRLRGAQAHRAPVHRAAREPVEHVGPRAEVPDRLVGRVEVRDAFGRHGRAAREGEHAGAVLDDDSVRLDADAQRADARLHRAQRGARLGGDAADLGLVGLPEQRGRRAGEERVARGGRLVVAQRRIQDAHDRRRPDDAGEIAQHHALVPGQPAARRLGRQRDREQVGGSDARRSHHRGARAAVQRLVDERAEAHADHGHRVGDRHARGEHERADRGNLDHRRPAAHVRGDEQDDEERESRAAGRAVGGRRAAVDALHGELGEGRRAREDERGEPDAGEDGTRQQQAASGIHARVIGSRTAVLTNQRRVRATAGRISASRSATRSRRSASRPSSSSSAPRRTRTSPSRRSRWPAASTSSRSRSLASVVLR